jgi:hypothetical protein
MKGTIKAYSTAVNAGLIIGEDGHTYAFRKSEWGGKENPSDNEKINFENEIKQAIKITNT